MNLLAVNSSPSRPSRTRAIAELAVELEGGRLLDVGAIDAEALLVATGRIPGHLLSLDAGLRVAVASVRGWSVPTVVYAVPEDFDEQGRPLERVRVLLAEALAEARLLAGARPAPTGAVMTLPTGGRGPATGGGA